MDACECNEMPRLYGTWPRGTKRALRYVFSCQQCALVVSMTSWLESEYAAKN